ncbi:MAG: ABC transporter ATP-binding protein [Candidatus Zixiibacteriota bacterium]|nr:MAG: ABC transporter ATP-binding protein [candidate division Zixibacteria bacterium]
MKQIVRRTSLLTNETCIISCDSYRISFLENIGFLFMIHLENVTYRYRDDGKQVLRNLNLDIQAGESVCIMGANGSGKSTLAKILAGLIDVKQGRVSVEAGDTSPMPVGILFQNPDNQIVSVTVEKEIAFALENLAVPQPEMERLITETLERFSITHLRSRLTSELSGGEKQRVALAGVMVCQPPILVLDEPDSFLDESGKVTLMEELVKLRQSNPSMIQIHITQYPSTAERYSRLIVLDGGAVAADAAPEEIFQHRAFCIKTGLSFSLENGRQIVIPTSSVNGVAKRPPSINRLVLRRVCFRYHEGHEVLRNISFDLEKGEAIGLVGPSGSGKSSLGLLLCGLLKPGSGSIEYLDDNCQSVPPDRLVGRVSAVFQQPERQFFLPTCSEEIAFGPKNLRCSLNETEIEALLAMVGLEPRTFVAKDPFTLSGGEKRRLAFAAVLSMSPQFVVFDEPTCGLDQEGVGRFILLAQALKQRGVGIVIITHDGDIIKTLTDKVLHLKGDSSWIELSRTEFFEGDGWAGVVSPPTSCEHIPNK